MDFQCGAGRPLKNWNGVWAERAAPDSLELHKFLGICIVSAEGWAALGDPDHLRCIGFHSFSLCGQWGGGLGRLFDSLEMRRCPSICMVAGVGRAAVLPQIYVERTKSTGVPRVCCDVSVSAIAMLIITTIATELK